MEDSEKLRNKPEEFMARLGAQDWIYEDCLEILAARGDTLMVNGKPDTSVGFGEQRSSVGAHAAE
jgi:hypothetical protein